MASVLKRFSRDRYRVCFLSCDPDARLFFSRSTLAIKRDGHPSRPNSAGAFLLAGSAAALEAQDLLFRALFGIRMAQRGDPPCIFERNRSVACWLVECGSRNFKLRPRNEFGHS